MDAGLTLTLAISVEGEGGREAEKEGKQPSLLCCCGACMRETAVSGAVSMRNTPFRVPLPLGRGLG